MAPTILLGCIFGALAGGGRPAKLSNVPLRAVVSDVDGTLFSFAGCGDLSDGNVKALSGCMDGGIHVCLATGRIPGPWLDGIRRQLPGLGPCVFGNGALVLDADGGTLWESRLSSDILSAVLEYTKGGVAAGNDEARLAVLAATHWVEGDDPYGGLRYCELAPDGPTHITKLIRGAGEPEAVVLPSLEGFAGRAVLKFVIWTAPGEEGWASMPETVAALKLALQGTGATILDHGERWCEVLPAGVNKGSGMLRMLAGLGIEPAEVLALGDAENDVEMCVHRALSPRLSPHTAHRAPRGLDAMSERDGPGRQASRVGVGT